MPNAPSGLVFTGYRVNTCGISTRLHTKLFIDPSIALFQDAYFSQ